MKILLNKRLYSVIIFILFLFLSLSSCKQKIESEIPDDERAAEVEKTIISKKELDEEWNMLTPVEKRKYVNKNFLLNELVENEIIAEHGIEKKYDFNPELIRRVNKYKRKLIKEYVIENEIKKRVTDDRISMFYNSNKHRFIEAERVRVRHILLEKSDEAEMILKKLGKHKEDFQKFAKLYSIDSTAQRGGDLGFFSRGRMVPDFENAAFSLQENGEISKIVKTGFGYHIIQLISRKNKSQLQFEEVRSEILDILLKEEKEKSIKVFKDSKRITIY